MGLRIKSDELSAKALAITQSDTNTLLHASFSDSFIIPPNKGMVEKCSTAEL